MAVTRNLYQVTFSDLSYRQYSAENGAKVYSDLDSPSNPIVSVVLVSSNVGTSETRPPEPCPPSPFPPFPPYYPPFPPAPPPAPAVPATYTNKLSLQDIADLYKTNIVFGEKTADAYRKDFQELKKGVSVYQFAAPSFVGGENVLVSAIPAEAVQFDADGGFANVSFVSSYKILDTKHQFLTKLRIFPDRIEGSSEDLTLQAQKETHESYSAHYTNVLPLAEFGDFYPSSSVVPDPQGESVVFSFNLKPASMYVSDFKAASSGKRIYQFSIPASQFSPVPKILSVIDTAFNLSENSVTYTTLSIYPEDDSIWKHTIIVRDTVSTGLVSVEAYAKKLLFQFN